MDPQAIESCINTLETHAPAEDAVFTLVHHPEESGQYVIKANRQGLQRYAAELLKASQAKSPTYGLPHSDQEGWTAWQGDAELAYVEILDGKPEDFKPPIPPKSSNHSRTIEFLFYGMIAIVLFFTILGIIETVQWLLGL